MKFDIDRVNGETAGLCIIPSGTGEAAINGEVEALLILLRAYSSTCGEKTKQRLRDAIGKYHPHLRSDDDFASCGIDYSDTPIRGQCYVYLWFDSEGELFYIGKGTGNRAQTMYGRTQEFRERAEGGYCRCVAYNIDEIYALDLERILIWESMFSGKSLLNVNGGNGVEAILYCKHDRDALLWYWDHEGTIGRFMEMSGIHVTYDARDSDVREVIDSRRVWWGYQGLRTNDPKVLEEMRKAEEKKQKQREYQRNRRLKKLESCRA